MRLNAGCGKTGSNASEFADGDGGRGSGGTGHGAGTSGGGDAGVGGESGSGNGAGTTSGGDAGASSGGSDTGSGGPASGAGSSGGGASGGAELDPFAEERREVATNYCALLETYECLNFGSFWTEYATREDMIHACRQYYEIQQASYGDACFDEWQALIECFTAAPWTCPCSDECTLADPGPVGHALSRVLAGAGKESRVEPGAFVAQGV